MMDLQVELRKLVALLDENDIDYALSGGLAMAVHGRARATVDFELLILRESLAEVLGLANTLGYNIRSKDLSFANGAVEIRRVSKTDPEDGELLSLDLFLATPDIRDVWESREQVEWEGGKLTVVSVSGLIALKQLRRSYQDLADIEALSPEGFSDES